MKWRVKSCLLLHTFYLPRLKMDDSIEKTEPGTGVFYGIMAVLSVGLLICIPFATQSGPANQGWWTQPWLMPTVSLVFFTGTAVYLFAQHLLTARRIDVQVDWAEVSAELFEWLRPLEFFIYYIIYIWLLGLVGYFLSSAIFATGICMRVGLRERRWVYISIIFALTLTALFRWGLHIFFPAAALFEIFPGGLRTFLIRNF